MTPKLKQLIENGILTSEEYLEHLEFALLLANDGLIKRGDFVKKMFEKFSTKINHDANEIYNILNIGVHLLENEIAKLKMTKQETLMYSQKIEVNKINLDQKGSQSILLDDQEWKNCLVLVKHLGITKEYVLEVRKNIQIREEEPFSIYQLVGIAKTVKEAGGIEKYNQQRHLAAQRSVERENFERDIKRKLTFRREWE